MYSTQTNPKFSPVTIATKLNIKGLRLDAKHSMNKGASLLGLTRKELEDVETTRNYGRHLDLEILVKVSAVYETSIDNIVGPVPSGCHVEYTERPRKRLGSKARNT